MAYEYPQNTNAVCYGLPPNAKEHDFVYLGRASVSMPMVVVAVEGRKPTIEELKTFADFTIGPFELDLHRCMNCRLGIFSDKRESWSRSPDEEERARLLQIETVKMQSGVE